MGRTKNYLSQVLLFLVILLTSCTVPSRNPTISPTSTQKFLSTSTLEIESAALHPIRQQKPPILLTPPSSTTPRSQVVVETVSTVTPSPTPISTTEAIATIPSTGAPVIHDLPGDDYETLFSISAGRRGILKYKIPTCCADIEGPNAIAVLSDETFLISDLLGRRLLNYDREGRLLKTIKLDPLGIGYVRDLRVKGNEIYLLEMTYQKFCLHRLTLDGELIASEEIPYQFPIDPTDKGFTLDNALTGIAVDCERRMILEVTGGSMLLTLAEV